MIGLALRSTSRIGRPLLFGVLLGRIDTQALDDRRQQVGDHDGPVLDLLAVDSGIADDLPAANSTAGQDGRPRIGKMVAAGVLVDFRGPAKLAHPDD